LLDFRNASFSGTPIVARRLTTSGISSAEPFASSPAEFGNADYTEKWRKLIRTSGIKVE
jgi:hypothetical protein